MVFDIWRIYRIAVLFMIIGSFLICRLIYIQLFQGHKLAEESLNMRVMEIPISIPRGNIYDCNGIPLTNEEEQYCLLVFPELLKNPSYAVEQIRSLIDAQSQKIIVEKLKEKMPFKLESALDPHTAKKIKALNLPGIIVATEKIRYGYTPLAAHVTGYINEIDNRGMSGIEAMYDEVLRGGEQAYIAAVVDAGQEIIPGLGYKYLRMAADSGANNITLSLNAHIQQIVEDVMDSHIVKGAVVIMEPATGEIIAMASRPSFARNNLNLYLEKDFSPFVNRALSAYQPGSVFKLVVAAAALDSGKIKQNDTFFDPGYIDVNNTRFYGWDYDKGGRGNISFSEALAYSSNPAFIKAGLKLGAEKLIDYAKKLGFGHTTSLQFYGESPGNLPSPETLYAGELANLAIGQGKLEATPLQIVSLVATICNDGIKVEPTIVKQIASVNGTILKTGSASKGVRVLSSKTAAEMRQMMADVTKIGTGQAAWLPDFGCAGKTGSAETGRIDASGHSVNHAWFTGYAPLQTPRYAAVVFVEEGKSGGDVAAPIFREIMNKILIYEMHDR